MAINIQEIADLLHIDEISADIYFELLTHTELSKEKLSAFTGKSKENVEQATKILLDRGFITPIETPEAENILKALSPVQIEERLDRERESFKNLKKFILPQIQTEQKLGIIKYEGWEGIRHVYTEILDEAIRTQEPILAFEKIPDKDHSAIGKVFLESYLEKRLKNNVLAKVITADTQASREYKQENNNGLTKTLIVKNLQFQRSINIVGNLVMSFSINPTHGTLRRNQIEAHDLKQVFNLLWELTSTHD